MKNKKNENVLTLEERIEQLHLKNSKKNMNLIGQLLVDSRDLTMWDRDTMALPRNARKWRKRARNFAQEHIRPLALEADLHPHDYDSRPILKAAAKKGLQSLLLPLPVGRTSVPAFLNSTVLNVAVIGEELATECGGLTLLIMAHYLGFAPLQVSGSIRIWLQHMLPLNIKNAFFGSSQSMAYAITEPAAGSDVEHSEGAAQARLVTTAKKVKGGYLLNGQKCFISNGAIADRITVFAKLEGEDIESWTCFLVKKDMKGFSVGRQEHKMGQRASDASEIMFDNVFVPEKYVIGKLRSGWANNSNVLNYSRPVVASFALGSGRGAFERCLEFCRKTTLGQKRLIDYQDIQLELSDMMLSLWSARTMVWHSARQFRMYQSASSAAKVFASDTAMKVCNKAMEIMGDHGYIHANGVERAWRDARLTQIYEGTNQMNRLAIIENFWNAEINNGATGYQE